MPNCFKNLNCRIVRGKRRCLLPVEIKILIDSHFSRRCKVSQTLKFILDLFAKVCSNMNIVTPTQFNNGKIFSTKSELNEIKNIILNMCTHTPTHTPTLIFGLISLGNYFWSNTPPKINNIWIERTKTLYTIIKMEACESDKICIN